jgi:predicted dehydrogenase
VIQQRDGRKPEWGDMTWQHRNWYSFVWICGDQIVEQHLHNIDVCNWVMGTHPVKVFATGGAAWRPRTDIYGNIYDHFASDFEYPNGVRMTSYCRQVPGASNSGPIFLQRKRVIVGSKKRSNAHDLAGNQQTRPYVSEHTAMLNSIRGDGPVHQSRNGRRRVDHDLHHGPRVGLFGEAITWDQIMNSQQDLFPEAIRIRREDGRASAAGAGVYKFR